MNTVVRGNWSASGASVMHFNIDFPMQIAGRFVYHLLTANGTWYLRRLEDEVTYFFSAEGFGINNGFTLNPDDLAKLHEEVMLTRNPNAC